jgi:hypothetical protein
VIQPNLRLVAGKPALFRAYVVSSATGVAAQVRATFSANGTALGTRLLDGPATVPTAPNEASLTDTYRTVLPADWVRSGLSVQLEVDPTNAVMESNESNNTQTIDATIGAGSVLYVKIVPIVQSGLTGAAPANWDQTLFKLWPVKQVDIQTRAAYTSSQTLASGGGGWSALLSDLDDLRTTEGSNRFYYGFARVGYTSGVAGIAYIGYPVGLGWDYASSGPGVAAHEFGHNFGALHAKCGATSGVDSKYPVSTGRLDTYGFDIVSGTLYAPNAYYDIMSYCKPSWVSSYMYNKVQTELESSPSLQSVSTGPSGNLSGPTQSLLLISGLIEASGRLNLRPVTAFQGQPRPPQRGSYRLRLETTQGVQDTYFDVKPIAHTGEYSFSFTVPNTATSTNSLRSIEVWKGATQLIVRRPVSNLRPLSAMTEPVLRESGGQAELNWDTTSFAIASLTHVATDGERTVLGLRLMGGNVRFDTRALDAGGRWELSLGDGLNSIARTYQR